MGELSLRDRRRRLLDRPDLTGTSFCSAFADEADLWLSELAERATRGNARHLALLAVGGYGRRALCPYSDLDVVLIHDGYRDVAAVADAIWYPVWDQGVHLDHSVRRPKEVLRAAASDLRVALGLLDARLVWGDARVAEPLIGDAIARWRSELGAKWLPMLDEQMAERRRAQGDVAFLLEPDLKEAHGGLRDLNVLQAIAVYAPPLANYVDLASLVPAATVLTDVRVELHRSANRALDRLILQEQDHVAATLSYPDADVLMSAVSEAGRQIAWAGEDAWRRRRLWQPGRSPRRLRGWRHQAGRPTDVPADEVPAREMEPGVLVVDGEVTLASSAPVATDPSLPLRLAAVAAEHDLPVARGAVHRLADKAPPPPDPWPPAMRTALVRVLAAGRPAIQALEALDQGGLLARELPEWESVRHRPQRNAYHRFTVDRHLLEAAANAAALADRVERADLLLVGTLLHDIGKGTPGDHVAVGTDQVEAIARRMGFSPGDVATLVTLVQHHLLLPDTATRRDLDDPATIEAVASAAGDVTTLELLAALTEADSQATGPSAWGSWKAGLVADLVDRTARHLQGAGPGTAGGLGHRPAEDRKELVEAVRDGKGPVVVLDPPRVLVAAPDRRGLLSSVAGVLALHGLDVRSADVEGYEGVAVEVFTVEVARGGWPDSERLRGDLRAVLAGQLPLGDHLAEKAAAYAGARRVTSAAPAVLRVETDNGASSTSTVVEVRAPDELGLLHQVTRAMFDCDLDVVSARVSTLGSEVVDAFYVRDAGGTKVTDPGALERMHEAVLTAISDLPGGAAEPGERPLGTP